MFRGHTFENQFNKEEAMEKFSYTTFTAKVFKVGMQI